jgi:hypothetical protein
MCDRQVVGYLAGARCFLRRFFLGDFTGRLISKNVLPNSGGKYSLKA